MHCRDVITMSTSAGYHAVKTLSEFWSKIDRTQLSPHDELLTTHSAGVVAHCLANVGKEYIVHYLKRRLFTHPALASAFVFGMGSGEGLVTCCLLVTELIGFGHKKMAVMLL